VADEPRPTPARSPGLAGTSVKGGWDVEESQKRMDRAALQAVSSGPGAEIGLWPPPPRRPISMKATTMFFPILGSKSYPCRQRGVDLLHVVGAVARRG
jgi:hypothetical protein